MTKRIFALLLLHNCLINAIFSQTDLMKYNVIWNSQSRNSSESMPVGGGDMGCNVWVENGDLLFYMQRSGCFNEVGEYVKLGRVRVKLSPNPFEEENKFRQELIVKDGYCEIKAGGKNDADFEVKLKFHVDVFQPVIHLDIESKKPLSARIAYESWRTADRELKDGYYGERFGTFTLEGYPGRVIKLKDSISTDKNGVLFYHKNPADAALPGILIEQQGMQTHKNEICDNISNRTFGGYMGGKDWQTDGISEGKYLSTPYRAWWIKSSKPATKLSLTISTKIEQTANTEQWKKQLLNLHAKAEKSKSKEFARSVKWWNNFWQRSWIVVWPDSVNLQSTAWQMGRNYQLMRYQLGCNAFGDYPSKFNGGNFTFDPELVEGHRTYDPDWRAWGGDVFTAQNQRLLYWPMLKAGDFDAIKSQFNLYQLGLSGAQARVRENFGHEGAMFCEYMNAAGLDHGCGYGWNGKSHRQRGPEIAFGDSSVNGILGYGKPVEKGIMSNMAVSYHWESQVEHAYMMLEYHRFTGADISLYLPFIKASLLFFDQHYQIRQKMRNGNTLDENGKLVFFPSTSCESYRGAKNPADLMAGIRACLSDLITLNAKYVSQKDRIYYREYLNRMPGFYYDIVKGDSIIKPAESYLVYQNVECPQFYPLFPFNSFDIESRQIPIFQNTWKHGTFPKNMVQSWHQDGIFYARMGMTAEAWDYNTKKLMDSPRRFPTFWGPGHDWVPDHNWGGSGMIGLQEMLMQTVGSKIHLFPAWPKDKDVSFKLHAPQNTTIECVLKKGKIETLIVIPEQRKVDVINMLDRANLKVR